MPFNPSPSSWLTNYSFSSDNISFDLNADYTSGMANSTKFIYRVCDEILRVYQAKPEADRPARWASTSSLIQPQTTSPVTIKTISNEFVLDANVLYDIANSTLTVSASVTNVVYNGFPYNGLTVTAPTGSSVLIEYSSDGGISWSQTAPTNPGSYIARVTATKDGVTGSDQNFFQILRPIPVITAPADITQEISVGSTISRAFAVSSALGSPTFSSIYSTNPSVVSVTSFTPSGSVTLQQNSVGTADIIAQVTETSQYSQSEGGFSVELTKLVSSISLPAITIPGTATSQPLLFTTNFTLDQARYNLLTITSDDTSVLTVTKNASYPPTINVIGAGVASVTISFPGDSVYQAVSSSSDMTVSSLATRMRPSVSPTTSVVFSGSQQFGTDWATGGSAIITLGTDADSDGIPETQASLPSTFTISLANPASPYTAATGALTYQWTDLFPSNNWISFSLNALTNSLSVTINSIPGNPGTVTGGTISIAKAASGVNQQWTASITIKAFKSGPTISVLASGLNSAASQSSGSFVPIYSSAVTSLNNNAQYASEWSVSDSCCPHEIYLKASGANGAPTTGLITATIDATSSGMGPVGIASFSAGSLTKNVQQDTAFSLFVNFGGSFKITFTPQGSTSISSVFEFSVGKITPTITASTYSDECCDPECADITGYMQKSIPFGLGGTAVNQINFVLGNGVSEASKTYSISGSIFNTQGSATAGPSASFYASDSLAHSGTADAPYAEWSQFANSISPQSAQKIAWVIRGNGSPSIITKIALGLVASSDGPTGMSLYYKKSENAPNFAMTIDLMTLVGSYPSGTTSQTTELATDIQVGANDYVLFVLTPSFATPSFESILRINSISLSAVIPGSTGTSPHALISYQVTPPGIAWDGLTDPNITVTSSDPEVVHLRSLVQAANGVAVQMIDPKLKASFTTITATLAESPKFNSFSISRTYRAKRPILRYNTGYTIGTQTRWFGYIANCGGSGGDTVAVVSYPVYTKYPYLKSCINSSYSSGYGPNTSIPPYPEGTLIYGNYDFERQFPLLFKKSFAGGPYFPESVGNNSKFTKTQAYTAPGDVYIGFLNPAGTEGNTFGPNNSYNLISATTISWSVGGGIIDTEFDLTGGCNDFEDVNIPPTVGGLTEVWSSPDLPYRNGFVGDYFDIEYGTPMTNPTPFGGGSWLGSTASSFQALTYYRLDVIDQ